MLGISAPGGVEEEGEVEMQVEGVEMQGGEEEGVFVPTIGERTAILASLISSSFSPKVWVQF